MSNPERPWDDRRQRTARLRAGACLAGAGLIYLGAEAVTARAWLTPRYSYAANWISDLGVPVRGLFAGRLVDSPLHALMNLGFLLSGALFFAGAVWVAVAAARTRSRAYVLCAALHGLGLALVALVPETTPLPAGNLHKIGALFAIGLGNLAVALGSRAAQPLVPLRLSVVGIILGTVGIASLLALAASSAGFGDALTSLGPGVVERASVYTITAWELWAGILLLIGPR